VLVEGKYAVLNDNVIFKHVWDESVFFCSTKDVYFKKLKLRIVLSITKCKLYVNIFVIISGTLNSLDYF